MTTLDSIWNRAEADLVIKNEAGERDVFLWEHSARVARISQQIAQLPELRSKSVDEVALLAAALYHDSGWVVRLREGLIKAHEIGHRARGDAHRQASASLMERSLSDLMSEDSLEKAAHAILTLNSRDIDTIEGQIVSEAENLDDIGPLSLWPIIRRGSTEGKGVKSVIDTWRRQKEYHFWEARINDAFHFEATRKLARARLDQHEHFMQELERQAAGEDLGGMG